MLHITGLEWSARDKHWSLFDPFIKLRRIWSVVKKNTLALSPWAQCYKTSYNHNLWIFVISFLCRLLLIPGANSISYFLPFKGGFPQNFIKINGSSLCGQTSNWWNSWIWPLGESGSRISHILRWKIYVCKFLKWVEYYHFSGWLCWSRRGFSIRILLFG